MERLIILNTENGNVAGNNPKGDKLANESRAGMVHRKKLADISNLPQRNQDVKQQISAKEYVEKLQQEIMMLTTLVADRNKIIELSAMELQKLRINYQKLQLQNLQFAQANSQMLAELNSVKDKLKALQHELGCKNGLLRTRNLELKEKASTMRCHIKGNKVETTKGDKAGQSSQPDKKNNEPCNTKRKRLSKIESLDPATVKPVQAKDKVGRSLCSRTQSARFKSGEEVPTDDMFKFTDHQEPTSVEPVQAETKVDEKRHLRRLSARFKSGEEATKDVFLADDQERTTVKPVQAQKRVDEKRPSRRLSVRFKSEEEEPMEDVFEITDDQEPTAVEPVQADKKVVKKRRSRRLSARFTSGGEEPNGNSFEISGNPDRTVVEPVQCEQEVDKKRICSRRQSARLKSQEQVQEFTENLFQIHDAKFHVSPAHEPLHESCPTSIIPLVKIESEVENRALRFETQELRRSSFRPTRRAVEKVQSYKEIPLNVKMRRG